MKSLILENVDGIKINPDGIIFKGPRFIKAFRNHRCKANVEQYYFIKHGITINYPEMYCIYEKSTNEHFKYYPLECIYVITYLSLNDLIFLFSYLKF
jgi:hypothetical protein